MGLPSVCKLGGSQDFEILVQRAQPARQDHKGFGEREHALLPLLQVGGNDQLLGRFQRRFEMLEECGKDADHRRAARPDCARHFAHQADIAAAEDQRIALGRQQRSQFPRGFRVTWIATMPTSRRRRTPRWRFSLFGEGVCMTRFVFLRCGMGIVGDCGQRPMFLNRLPTAIASRGSVVSYSVRHPRQRRDFARIWRCAEACRRPIPCSNRATARRRCIRFTC